MNTAVPGHVDEPDEALAVVCGDPGEASGKHALPVRALVGRIPGREQGGEGVGLYRLAAPIDDGAPGISHEGGGPRCY